ncbi:DNA gyrase inhibitor YacG [Chromatium okenii]|uniref:DNA gyrase inhibitor YacG n=1 Tax=Chromatium okenii TaxID=61644 RepID=UPI00190509F7|nr:DNA gyrase inhibitor YacG [Chromatium okenii]MBK1641956.1 DNA gyrase inhibitor YacG [Chromatium okenii]
MTELVVHCPHCGAEVIWNEAARWRPFCSHRCRLIDLGAWFDESHRIPDLAPAPLPEPEVPQ